MSCATFLISFSFIPREVRAGVPILMPDGLKGEGSPGTEFLLAIMPARSSLFSASMPSRPKFRTSIRIRCKIADLTKLDIGYVYLDEDEVGNGYRASLA